MKKTIELQANASTPPGATIRLTVEYRSKKKNKFIVSAKLDRPR